MTMTKVNCIWNKKLITRTFLLVMNSLLVLLFFCCDFDMLFSFVGCISLIFLQFCCDLGILFSFVDWISLVFLLLMFSFVGWISVIFLLLSYDLDMIFSFFSLD